MAVGVPQPHSLLQGLQRPSEIGARPADTRGRSILVTGRWRLELATSGRRSELELLTLDAPGDYSVREKGVEHRWQADEDSVVLTVCWPSLP